MESQSGGKRSFRVAVFAVPDDLDTLSEILSSVLVMHPTDAMKCARHAPGFVSERLTAETAQRLGLRYVRAGTPGSDPRFVSMVRELIEERLDPAAPRSRLGGLPVWDACPVGCCVPPAANHDATARSSTASHR